MSTTTLSRVPVILRCTPRNSNSLRAFVDVQLPSGMILHDVQIHVRAAAAWAMPSSREMIDRNGVVMRDDAGKTRWLNQVSFTDKPTRTRFSDAVVEAIRVAYPDVLAPAA
jgi:hypothetical protein